MKPILFFLIAVMLAGSFLCYTFKDSTIAPYTPPAPSTPCNRTDGIPCLPNLEI